MLIVLLLNGTIVLQAIHPLVPDQFGNSSGITFLLALRKVPTGFTSTFYDTPKTSLEQLHNDLALIEAIEERNRAQIYSFIDEQDQWESMEEDDRQLLLKKDMILEQIKQHELDV